MSPPLARFHLVLLMFAGWVNCRDALESVRVQRGELRITGNVLTLSCVLSLRASESGLEGGVGFSLVPWRAIFQDRMGQRMTAIVNGERASWEFGANRGVSL